MHDVGGHDIKYARHDFANIIAERKIGGVLGVGGWGLGIGLGCGGAGVRGCFWGVRRGIKYTPAGVRRGII